MHFERLLLPQMWFSTNWERVSWNFVHKGQINNHICQWASLTWHWILPSQLLFGICFCNSSKLQIHVQLKMLTRKLILLRLSCAKKNPFFFQSVFFRIHTHTFWIERHPVLVTTRDCPVYFRWYDYNLLIMLCLDCRQNQFWTSSAAGWLL